MAIFDELFPLQAVINLDKRPDRLEICMKEVFPKINISPLRKPGVIFDKTSNTWWNGAIGCMLSHYQLIQISMLWNANIFIFEDDVKWIDNDTYSILEAACKELSNIEWDMFYMGGNLLKPCYQISEHLAKLTHCQSTVAYGINKNFAERLLSYINLTHIDRPIDVIYADNVIPNHSCFITIPMLAIQRDSYSDIEGGIVKYSDYLEKRYWENLKKT